MDTSVLMRLLAEATQGMHAVFSDDSMGHNTDGDIRQYLRYPSLSPLSNPHEYTLPFSPLNAANPTVKPNTHHRLNHRSWRPNRSRFGRPFRLSPQRHQPPPRRKVFEPVSASTAAVGELSLSSPAHSLLVAGVAQALLTPAKHIWRWFLPRRGSLRPQSGESWPESFMAVSPRVARSILSEEGRFPLPLQSPKKPTPKAKRTVKPQLPAGPTLRWRRAAPNSLPSSAPVTLDLGSLPSTTPASTSPEVVSISLKDGLSLYRRLSRRLHPNRTKPGLEHTGKPKLVFYPGVPLASQRRRSTLGPSEDENHLPEERSPWRGRESFF